jgi:hypothetical protein
MSTYRKNVCKVAMFLISLVLSPTMATDAFATFMYNYTGPQLTISYGGDIAPYDHISGSFTLAAPLPTDSPLTLISPISYHFFDGVRHFTTGDAGGGNHIDIATTAGEISEWSVSCVNGYTTRGTDTHPSPYDTSFELTSYGAPWGFYENVMTQSIDWWGDESFFNEAEAGSYGPPGTWSGPTDNIVPVPPSILLLAPGIAGLIALKRRLRK